MSVKSIAPIEEVTAYINPSNCINCGTCREICPVGAIQEYQRIICHGCATCTDKPGISPQEMKALTTAQACTIACPLGISPQGYVNLTKIGKYEEAYKLVWEKNPLPSVCARVCHHPCEDDCKRGIIVDRPIAIRAVKRYLGGKVDYIPAKYPRIYDERIAVIGAGPAGITAGHYLSMSGYEVTVFESAQEAGGMLKRGIPEFRLDRGAVDSDISKLQAAGLDIRLGYRIDQFTLNEIKKEYDVIIVATGTPNSKELQIEGWRLAGVMSALNYMEHVNHNQDIRRHLGQLFHYEGGEAVVIGGGSVAIDSARTALRSGASKVTLVCLESGEDVPAHSWELQEAKEEGVQIIEGYSPSRYLESFYPTLTGVEFNKVKSIKKDDSGRITFETDKNDILTIKADWVVVAIGQSADQFWLDQKGDNVYFTGDIASNKCSVIDAMAFGKKTAQTVDSELRHRELKDSLANHELHTAPPINKIFPYNRRKAGRPAIPTLSVESRISSFADVESTFGDREATEEVQSCLGCGYQVVDQEKCIACGLCQKLCPKGDSITLEVKLEGGAQ